MNGVQARPLIQGTFGVVTTTHYVGTTIAWDILARGGNAFDAACAAGFALQVVEPHLCGPAGEAPMLLYSRTEKRVVAVCGQGPAPAAATLDRFRGLGLALVPGTGLTAATVPAAFDAWILVLARYGTMTLEDVLGPAVALAENGHPLIANARLAIGTVADQFRAHWPSSAAIYLPNGAPPRAGALFRNPDLAASYRAIIAAERASRAQGRAAALEAARAVFYSGPIAETIDRFCRTAEVMDVSGRRNPGLLTGADLARYRGRIEPPASIDYHGLTLHKLGAWSQGPAFLQQLQLLAGFDLAAMGHNSADYLHTVIETYKLAFADREHYYGDPDFADVPLATLLADDYADLRREMIDPAHASLRFHPGRLPGYDPNPAYLALAQAQSEPAYTPQAVPHGRAHSLAGVGEPATTRHGAVRGDTVHIDVIDCDGNMISATPSGGWLQSSPVVPGLGFPLGTRGQMFWLIENHPNSLAPGKRPRTTLTPSLATKHGEPHLAFGSPGGDQQDQWTLHFLLNHLHFGMNLQAAIEAPEWQSAHIPDSFYPRPYTPAGVVMEDRMAPEIVAELRRRGHRIALVGPWENGRHIAAARDPETGVLSAAASPRSGTAYAIGR